MLGASIPWHSSATVLAVVDWEVCPCQAVHSPLWLQHTPVAPSTKIAGPLYPTAPVLTRINPSGAKLSGISASAEPLSKTFGSLLATFTIVAVQLRIPAAGHVAPAGAGLVL